jgi:hypothetical protein
MPIILESFIQRRSKNIRIFWRLGNDTKIYNAKYVRLYLEMFLGGGSYENSPQNESVRFVSEAQLCREHQITATTSKISLRKKG